MRIFHLPTNRPAHCGDNAARGARGRRGRHGQKGSASVAVAGGLAVTIGMAALVIDIGQLLATHAELQMVADLAAKSAARELARVYISAGRSDPLSDTLNTTEQAQVTEVADQRARRNRAGAVPISVDESDVLLGKWNDKSGTFVKTSVGIDSVQVRARRDEVSNGMVSLLFPGILGRSAVGMKADAAARISGVSYLPAGTADFPIAISKNWYATHASPCSVNNTITFYPTGTADGCAGWHTFQTDPANASALKSILNGLRTGSFISPEIDVTHTQFIFNGGVVASAMNELKNLYDAKKNGAGEMSVLIPVYDSPDCSNPNGWLPIIGVARAIVTDVNVGSEKYVHARVECDVIEFGESGGPDFGVLAAGPDLVR